MAHPYLADPVRPRVLAHRGLVRPADAARGVAENTRAAFRAALAAGARYLETDCRATRDGEIVLVHDAELGRVAGDPRRVADLTHAELGALLAGRGGLLTLDEALAEFPDARFNVDVKAAEAAAGVGRIAAGQAHRVLVTSFSEALRRAALAAAAAVPGSVRPATAPGRGGIVRVLLAVASGSRARVARALAGIDALQIPERQGIVPVLTPRVVDAAHRHGVEVHVWTVNDPARMRALVARGVDGIITDRADLALSR
ncbi:glycerophosphodiester phosphodiesterase [Leucobacter allii]|uniref:Glycerophosphodiester phosphodiesterase n=1 Tax=Leucobacter allii TaxID=2932247 RepID=A0ABY4FPS8_9MICO|nr:glycerophosphodiester phosphodiesterase family protein [Leucobacter allii]UOQ58293.1 glycerophosphodiester phosphodiesterase [Leucobacter allii]